MVPCRAVRMSMMAQKQAVAVALSPNTSTRGAQTGLEQTRLRSA